MIWLFSYNDTPIDLEIRSLFFLQRASRLKSPYKNQTTRMKQVHFHDIHNMKHLAERNSRKGYLHEHTKTEKEANRRTLSGTHQAPNLPRSSSISPSATFSQPARFFFAKNSSAGPTLPHNFSFRLLELLEHETATQAQASQHIHSILTNTQAPSHGEAVCSARSDAVTHRYVKSWHGQWLGRKWQ